MPALTNGLILVRARPKWDQSPMRTLVPIQLLSPSILWNMPLQPASKVHCTLLFTACPDRFRVALREAVANLYNHTYRQGKNSQYTYENVCIVPGGRAGLSRVAAVVGDVFCVCISARFPIQSSTDHDPQSYQIPDYTAYDQVLSAFKRLVPVPTV